MTVNSSVSIVCVYNDPAVRRECLDRSVRAYGRHAPGVEYLPVDNVDGRYRSAGAALNHGASLAGNDVVVFVHQDVFLHSLAAVIRVAGQMQAGGLGVLGAVGVRRDGRITGRIRDRAVLLGVPVQQPVDVDSVDELLFMVPRPLVLRHPLTESPDMAWHAYGVEYGLRVRRLGLRVGVTDIPLTHNSRTANLARLDVAHAAIAARYPEMLPVRTTCGVVARQTARSSSSGWLGSQRWRYSWLRESLTVRKARRITGAPIVLADIRRDVDNVIERAPGRRLRIVNCSGEARFMDADGGPLELTRGNGRVVVDARQISDIPAVLAAGPPGSWFLLTNMPQEDLGDIGARWRSNRQVVGFHAGIGFWILLGAAAADLPPHWRSERSVPLGTRRLVPEPCRPPAQARPERLLLHLIRTDSALAGFIFIRGLSGEPRVVGDFFVVRAARRKHVGHAAALQLLRLHPGRWEIAFQEENPGAARFWRRVGADVAGHACREERRPVPDKPWIPPDTWLLLST